MKPYLWKQTPKRARPKGFLHLYKEPKTDETIMPVQGKLPDSIEEYRLAKSLEKLGVDFDFQVPIHGGNRIRGGLILDFLLFVPYPRPLQVQGPYWHSGWAKKEDAFKLAVLRQVYQTEPIVVQSYKLTSQEESDAFVVRELL